jgi:hypothetical protein
LFFKTAVLEEIESSLTQGMAENTSGNASQNEGSSSSLTRCEATMSYSSSSMAKNRKQM